MHAVKNFYFGNLAYFWRISQVFKQIKESLDNFRQARIDVDIVIKWTQKCFQKKEIHYRSLEILLTTNREKVLKQIFINVFDRNIIKTKQHLPLPLFDYLSVKSDTHIFDTALSNLVHIVHIKGK